MQRLILSLVGIVVAGTAQAADLPEFSPIVSYEPTPLVSTYQPGGFNWNSYFVGASALLGATDPFALGGDVFVGVTATAGDFLYGGVLSAGALSGEDDVSYHIELASRFGAVVTDDVAAYAIIGGGYETEIDSPYVAIGGGVSVAVADNISVEASLTGNYLTDVAVSDDNWRLIGALGVAFHF